MSESAVPGRRRFLGSVAAAAAGAALPVGLDAQPAPISIASAEWDMSWRERVTGQFRAVFDSPGIEDGAGLWRAVDWKKSIMQVYGVPATDVSSVLVLRHEAIPMVVNDEFWKRHKVGKDSKVKDPDTNKWAERNPFANSDNLPADARGREFSIAEFIKAGGIVLACNYAFGFLVSKEAQKEKLKFPEARTRTLEHLLPGIILQPSGFFATLEAQRAGCQFFPASSAS